MISYAATTALNVAFRDAGAKENPVIFLLHGWPDDATTWNYIIPELVKAGYRVIAPWMRGFGSTAFKDDSISRTGNSGILAFDAIELMDTLGIQKFTAIGHDWGSNIAEALAVGWPERVVKIALLSSPPRLGGSPTPLFRHAQLEWYHWFMATSRGAEAVNADPIGFARLMWENWSPAGWFSEALFEQVSESWKNPDFVNVTIHSYRSRWNEAEPDIKSTGLEERIKATETLALPVLYIQGEADGVNPPYVSENVYKRFKGYFKRVLLPGVGHFPSREAPAKLSKILLEFLKLH